jgi:hypothetical protein
LGFGPAKAGAVHDGSNLGAIFRFEIVKNKTPSTDERDLRAFVKKGGQQSHWGLERNGVRDQG